MNARRRLVLVCNSHIDPVWLWPWQEGLAATLSTFRAAADLCERFESFVFCHNEAVLYRWVEEYEPALFARIRSLVQDGRWHIMGGWYLQPDGNLPSGESFVRQILVGRRYFHGKFDVEPRVAVNLDPFGHSRGLVQILKKSGYDGYLFCRPDPGHLPLESNDFVWVGYDGSTVLAHRAVDHYNSSRGHARARTDAWLAAHPDVDDGLLLWGVGNHGGGPSREDLTDLAHLMAEPGPVSVVHGTPDDYFGAMAARATALPRVATDLNPWAVGCYSSMSTVKRAHRQLEQRYFTAEHLAAECATQDLLPYPKRELADALDALLFCQFHDILPGSSIADVEAQALQRLHFGLEVVERLRTRAFFALTGGQPEAADGDYPILVFNHRPHPLTDTLVCEFQPPEPNPDRRTVLLPELAGPDGTIVPSQLEKESCNIRMDHRKRLVFRVPLRASGMTRLTCRLRSVPREAERPLRHEGPFRIETDECSAEIDAGTGLLSSYRVGSREFLSGGAFRPLALRDSADPWGMKVRAFKDVLGAFALVTPARAATFAGVSAPELAPVRVIEDGPVRMVVESILEWRESTVCLRYALPRQGTEVLVHASVSWHERDTMLKLDVPTTLDGLRVRGEVAYGTEAYTRVSDELLAHTWVAGVSGDASHALTIINDGTYGFDISGTAIRPTLLRSPAYAGHPVEGLPIVRQDRVEPRIDQGTHEFRFWLNGGPADVRLANVPREAASRQDGPIVLNVFPSGRGKAVLEGVTLSDGVVQMTACKISEDGRSVVVRLFEPTGDARRTRLRMQALGVDADVALGPFEIRTLAINLATGFVADVDLMERRKERSDA
jgi:alpha-mannosidase